MKTAFSPWLHRLSMLKKRGWAKMIGLGVNSPAHYWMEVVHPNWLHFQAQPTQRAAFNLCVTLWHLIDWVWEDEHLNPSGMDLGAVRAKLEGACAELSVAHDVASSSKHRRVTRPRGGVEKVEVKILGATFYFSKDGPVSEHPCRYTVTYNDGASQDLAEVLEAAWNFWTEFFKGHKTLNDV